MFRRGRDELIGRRITKAFPSVEGSAIPVQYRAVLAKGKAREFRLLSPILKRWTAFSVYPRQGGGISVQFRDVSAEVEAEQALRASETRLRLALRIGRLGSYEWTPDNGLFAVSDEYAAIH